MHGFGLLLGHLIGDYIVQNDWMAANKTNSLPEGVRPGSWIRFPGGAFKGTATFAEQMAWDEQLKKWWVGNLACFVHCLCYTLAVWACCWWWVHPAWMLVVFAAHFPVDRWRLARWWMVNVSGQSAFATGILSPWSIIVVDNTIHLAVLFGIGMAQI